MAFHKPSIREIGIVEVSFGSGVEITNPVNLYGCSIGNDCFIGPFVEIQRNAIIGNRTRIQSHCFVCELVTIGEDCFIGHGVMFINDLFKNGKPSRGQKELWKATKIGNHVSIGSNATLLPINICDNVVVGAGAVVSNDITVSGIYQGAPAQLVRAL
jgi:acetyltransferase-like isoleucine patch superfamily enzyme